MTLPHFPTTTAELKQDKSLGSPYFIGHDLGIICVRSEAPAQQSQSTTNLR